MALWLLRADGMVQRCGEIEKCAEAVSEKTSRALRRHHENRVKVRWRVRVKLWNLATAGEEERIALRRAHHNKCPCWMCGVKMNRKPEAQWRTDPDVLDAALSL